MQTRERQSEKVSQSRIARRASCFRGPHGHTRAAWREIGRIADTIDRELAPKRVPMTIRRIRLRRRKNSRSASRSFSMQLGERIRYDFLTLINMLGARDAGVPVRRNFTHSLL